MKSQHPEIQALQNILQQHQFAIEAIEAHPNFTATEHLWVKVHLNQYSFVLLIDDEYKDFQLQNRIMNLCLMLRELETYEEANDILQWCNFKGLEVSNAEVLSYYKGLSTIYAKVEESLGRIDSQISDLDFGLNAGAAQELRRLAKID
jgi:hypothetical protein